MVAVFILQTAVGILGNSSVLLYYVNPGLPRNVLITLIVKLMSLTNSVSIISRGIPQIMARLG